MFLGLAFAGAWVIVALFVAWGLIAAHARGVVHRQPPLGALVRGAVVGAAFLAKPVADVLQHQPQIIMRLVKPR